LLLQLQNVFYKIYKELIYIYYLLSLYLPPRSPNLLIIITENIIIARILKENIIKIKETINITFQCSFNFQNSFKFILQNL
jgi:hypothetical protein